MTDGVSHLLKSNIQGSACHYVFRFDLLGNLRFPVGLFHEDEAFTPLLFLRAKTLLPTDITAYFYRRCPSSITTRRSRAHFETRLNQSLGSSYFPTDDGLYIPSRYAPALPKRPVFLCPSSEDQRPLPVAREALHTEIFLLFVARQYLCRTLPSPPPVASDKAGGVSLGSPNA